MPRQNTTSSDRGRPMKRMGESGRNYIRLPLLMAERCLECGASQNSETSHGHAKIHLQST